MTLVSNPETEKPRRSQVMLETPFSWDRLDSVLLDCAQMLEHSPVAPQPAKQAAADAASMPPSLAEKPAQAAAPARLSQAAAPPAAHPPHAGRENSVPQAPGWRPFTDEREMEKAATLVKSILASPQPAQAVAEKLEDIDRLLPALLELNIRQALHDGRPDLAKSLTALARSEPTCLNARPMTTAQKTVNLTGGPKPLRVLFWSGNHANIVQQTIPAGALADRGLEVSISAGAPNHLEQGCDVIVARNPHANPELIPALAQCAAAGASIILDLDQDIEQLPLDHPDYAEIGLTSPEIAKAYFAALGLADCIRTPNSTLAASYRQRGFEVSVIPDGWSNSNPLWNSPPLERSTIHIGWVGRAGQVEDVFSIRRIIVRALREFHQTRLVIIGDPEIYQLFDHMPESRKAYYPLMGLEDHPYLLRQLDILLAPLRNTPFNQTQTDLRLMEAGVRAIPWIASPMPAFAAWEQGGLLAGSLEEWHTHLRQLILDADLRRSLGLAGQRKAEDRTSDRLGEQWESLIEKVIHNKD